MPVEHGWKTLKFWRTVQQAFISLLRLQSWFRFSGTSSPFPLVSFLWKSKLGDLIFIELRHFLVAGESNASKIAAFLQRLNKLESGTRFLGWILQLICCWMGGIGCSVPLECKYLLYIVMTQCYNWLSYEA